MPAHTHASRSLHYTRTGGGPAVLFHHGLGSDHAQGPALLGGLPCMLVCPDAPSHGRSAGAPELHTFDALADAVVALLDHMGLDSVVLAGLSMGAGAGLNVALRHPGRARALVLLRPAWLDAPGPASLAVVARMGRWLCEEGREGAGRRLRDDAFYRDMLEAAPGAAASLATLLEFPPERARVLADMVEDAPFASMAELAGVDVPALVISNDADPLHPVGMAESIAAAIPRAEHHHVPARYAEPERHRGAVFDVVGRFLRREDVSG